MTEDKAPRPVCMVHPGRPVVGFCRQCRRPLCRLCLLGRSDFCSRPCRDKYIADHPLIAPQRHVLLVLGLTTVLATLLTALMLVFFGVL